MINLTHQQETFARAVVSGKNQSDAYREAYPTSLTWPVKTLWTRASELMAEGKVAGRVKELRKPAVEAVEMSAKAHVARLALIRDAALQAGDHGPAVRAEMAIGQVAGHYVQQLEVKNDMFSRYSAQQKLELLVALDVEVERRQLLVADDVQDVEVKR